MKPLKAVLFIEGLLLCFGGFCSCSDGYLDETVTTDLDEDKVFTDSSYTAGFLTQIYVDIGFQTMPTRFGNGGLQIACDEAEFKNESSITTGMALATGTLNPNIVSDDCWKKCYANIRRVNKFLENVHRSPMVQGVKDRYYNEARFLRAWYYAALVRDYGGVPLVGDTCYSSDDVIPSKRMTWRKSIDYIVDECNAVIASNTLPVRATGRINGRATEAVCLALISRMKLYDASPLHNNPEGSWGTEQTKELLGNTDYSKERWKDAADAALDVMRCGDYALYVNHKDGKNGGKEELGWGYYAITHASDFTTATKCTTRNGEVITPYGPYQEIIFERKMLGLDFHSAYDPISCGGSGRGGYVYADLADAFPMADGRAVDDNSGKYVFDPVHPNVNRDPRFANCVVYDGATHRNSANDNYTVRTCTGDVTTQDEVRKGTPTGFFTRKFTNRECAANWWISPSNSFSLIRYAEILLNYAEATNEYYGPSHEDMMTAEITDADGNVTPATYVSPITVLKMLRERAGIEPGDDGMYGLKDGMTQEEMREAIRLERRLELCFEGHRFYDVRRWMIADQTDGKPMHGLEIMQKNGNTSYKYFTVRTHIWRPALYFMPIPYQEVVKSKDGELLQNPYYD